MTMRQRTAPPLSRRLAWVPYVVFVFLALRTDSLFAPINALHWEYVLGPIRAIREGGWLLWDVPSQYGFLSVLIPAMLPFRTPVDAFYWFQAASFVAASAIFYRTLYAVLGLSRLAACAVVVAFFFFADPLLIGPSGYPSMSAVRFLWCYALLALAAANFLGDRPSAERFARAGSLIWIVAVMWSAESAIYATVIFFTPLCLRTTGFRSLLKMFLLPGLCVVGVLGVLEAVYLAGIRHSPDWSMFIAYIRSYGGGFGERPIALAGPVWLVAMIIFSGASAFWILRRREEQWPACAAATASAAVWIVSSYYLGRAYPVVITMLSPLLILSALMIVRARAISGHPSLQAAVVLPFMTLGLVSVFWNANVPAIAANIARPSVEVREHLPVMDPELAALLAGLRISPATPVVYYDQWVAMPRAPEGPYDRNWLPTPLQQLEKPIPVSVREKIVTRFVMRHKMSGYFIQALSEGNNEPGARAWIDFLSRFYRATEVARSANYRVLRFDLRPPSGAGNSQ